MTATSRALALAAAGLLVCAGSASGHVDVLPREVPAEEPAEFTVRVPNERDLPTTSVQIDFPSDVTVFSFADPPRGWTLTPQVANDGRIVGVDYDGKLGADRFVDFSFLGTPFEPGTAVWPTRQTYADGKVKPWTGPPEDGDEASVETGPTDPGPAAAVEVRGPDEAAGLEAVAAASDDDDSGAGIWLGVIAIVIAVLSALGVGLLWSSRPARLPEDPE